MCCSISWDLQMHDGVPFRQGAHSIDLPRYEGLYNRHQQDPNHVSRPQFNPPPHPPPINSWQYQPTYTQPNPPPNPQPIPPPNYQPNPIIHMQNPTAQPGYVVQQQPLGVIIVVHINHSIESGVFIVLSLVCS